MLAKDNESYFREFTGSPKDLVQTAKQGAYRSSIFNMGLTLYKAGTTLVRNS